MLCDIFSCLLLIQKSVVVGPESVGYRITEDALCFGGGVCTTTDVAIAAGVAPSDFCRTPEAVANLGGAMVYSTMREIRKMLETAIDSMKVYIYTCTEGRCKR